MRSQVVRAVATEVTRRVRARRASHSVSAAVRPVPEPPADERPGDERAGTAELDALRGALVRELDRLAAADEGSAGFRRA